MEPVVLVNVFRTMPVMLWLKYSRAITMEPVVLVNVSRTMPVMLWLKYSQAIIIDVFQIISDFEVFSPSTEE